MNGDGYADVIVGAPGYDAPVSGIPAVDAGGAFVFLGSAAGIPDGTPETAATRLLGDQAGGFFGAAVASAGDVNGDGYADLIIGAWHYDAGQSDESAAFVFHGSGAGVADADASEAAAQIESDEAGNGFIAVAGAGDVNADGYDDVIVGLPNYGGTGDAGAAMVFHGSASGIPSGSPIAGGYASWIPGDQSGGQVGASVAAAGDVSGDGYADVIVGAPRYDDPAADAGVAYVLLGGAGGIPSGAPSGTAYARLAVGDASGLLGGAVAGAGDVDGDGYDDVIVGASYFGASDKGAAFVWRGGNPGIVDGDPSTANPRLNSASPHFLGSFGTAVAGAGDVNGDGYSDVIVGAPDYVGVEGWDGAAFVFLGGPEGLASVPATRFDPEQSHAEFGSNVAAAGDVNGDGYDDVIVGAPAYDDGPNINIGAFFIFLGSASGIANGTPATAATRFLGGANASGAGDVNGDGYADVVAGAGPGFSVDVFLGSASGIPDGTYANVPPTLHSDLPDGFGSSVRGAGDVNGDGYADVIVGASGYDGRGAAFVFLGSATGIANGGPSTAAARLESDQAASEMGSTVAAAGDVNGDGYGDVIVDAPAYDAGQTDEGAAFVFLGSAIGISNGTPATAAARLESDQPDQWRYMNASGAGDVNGDGYADVIVGFPSYDAGQALEGAAFIFLGSASAVANGNPSTAAAQLEGNFSTGQFVLGLGVDVAAAGDVNGDGYGDVIVGDPAVFDPATDGTGSALVFLGNGNRPGLPVLARQFRGDGSGIPVPAWGSSHSATSFRVSMHVAHPQTRGRVKLEVEACSPGLAFGALGCIDDVAPAWTDVSTSAGVTLEESVDGLTAGALYRWRARALYAPSVESGIAIPAQLDHGHWHRLAGQANEADIRTLATACSNGIDDDGDGAIDYPADAGCASANDDSERSDGAATTASTTTATARSTSLPTPVAPPPPMTPKRVPAPTASTTTATARPTSRPTPAATTRTTIPSARPRSSATTASTTTATAPPTSPPTPAARARPMIRSDPRRSSATTAWTTTAMARSTSAAPPPTISAALPPPTRANATNPSSATTGWTTTTTVSSISRTPTASRSPTRRRAPAPNATTASTTTVTGSSTTARRARRATRTAIPAARTNSPLRVRIRPAATASTTITTASSISRTIQAARPPWE